ncbi:MAG: acetate--CoA ligase [Candidatus Andersenbacteria bacterium]|nr:acetate--CoA ligase [Candidatus Andersenbacteria bacterium]
MRHKTHLRLPAIPSIEAYHRMYRQSIRSPAAFWGQQAEEHLHWFKKWRTVLSTSPGTLGKNSKQYVRYFDGGTINASYNCLDRHLPSQPDKPAIIWQGENPRHQRTLTYQQLHAQVSLFATVLRKQGIKKGDIVTIFMPAVPETAVAMLACARIGAPHCVVFSAFSALALRQRLRDSKSKLILTADEAYYGGKTINLKQVVDDARVEAPHLKKVIVLQRNQKTAIRKARGEYAWHILAQQETKTTAAAALPAEHPLFILYTSGSTGSPKGIVHTTAGYLLYVHATLKYIFSPQPDDMYWCTADVGWITGHSYGIYGPLSSGLTIFMYEGALMYPKPDRVWRLIEQYKISILYTAPTAIRSFMAFGDKWPKKHNLKSLQVLGSVGEPINPAAWKWYFTVIGNKKCPVVDTWWQTETGGIAVSPLAGITPLKPGSATLPFFGISPHIQKGQMVIKKPWPGMLRKVWGDKRNTLLKKLYFPSKGQFMTGDSAREDKDGYYWFEGRLDDVINVAAHRFATAEIESALVSHPSVAEAAVVGFPHPIKGQGIYAFVIIKKSASNKPALAKQLVAWVRKQIGPIATIDSIQVVKSLPKTRSGKIMRRLLRTVVSGTSGMESDTSTLANPESLAAISSQIKTRA